MVTSSQPEGSARSGQGAIEVVDAVALLGRFPALTGLSLTIEAASVVLLQGPNGAGKTTLLRLLAGLTPLTSGRTTVLGHDVVTDRRAVRSAVGLVGPRTMLYDDLTVAENLAFWARLAGDAQAPVDAALDRLGLQDQAATPVRVLSTGQRRRAAIAAIAIRRPRVWLLDEPHAGLDQQGRAVVDQLIGDAVEAGATVVVASHELDRVLPLATDVVTIAGGSVRSHDRVALAAPVTVPPNGPLIRGGADE